MNKIFKKLINQSKSYFKKIKDPAHDINHTKEVVKTARKFLKK